ncbi:hypothetical protein QWY31_06775 [Cytophagales bacterium LB-30]|uniref:Uncharacterized protein n=1 Tax=Shiella aurantiaca TaxID=3058365 RepID=A0ABT8F439_9BACT|nr:hypothetical protein [Shiella aurantiaca]MDN4165197.1 hypothetical protein [Shiella aurantiaca]
MKRIYFLFVAASLGLSACFTDPVPVFPVEEVQGFKPVYAEETDIEVKLMSPQAMRYPGKIYVLEDYLFINDLNYGVHVYDNSNPYLPRKLGFIQIIGNQDIAIRNGVMYADYLENLIAIDLRSYPEISVTERILNDREGVSNYPPNSEGGYFECVDPSRGTVIGWVRATLYQPNCYR